MDSNFPGTVVSRQGKSAEEFLSGLFFATKGIMLLQVKEITGLETPVIQNWVGRGILQTPVEKRYSANHLARIMIINMLRSVTRLDIIVKILEYINDAPNDNVISEAELYIAVCGILDEINYETVFSDVELDRVIEKHTAKYSECSSAVKKRLSGGMKTILTYYAASLIKVRADRRMEMIESTISIERAGDVND